MIVGTAGHIDHGKTALVRGLTGVDTDRLHEEKARGISIDLGFAYLPLPDGGTIGFVDVPGHERFIRNMVAGATGIDFVLLVVRRRRRGDAADHRTSCHHQFARHRAGSGRAYQGRSGARPSAWRKHRARLRSCWPGAPCAMPPSSRFHR